MTLESVTDNEIQENQKETPDRRLREVVSDAYTFIRSMEANQAFATVTFEQLMSDQIKRNGESSRSNATQYNPYSYTERKEKPAGIEPAVQANFLGGSDTGGPTKYDRVLALVNELSAVITEIKKLPPVAVADSTVYADAASNTVEEEDV